jgi:hypothetical protein
MKAIYKIVLLVLVLQLPLMAKVNNQDLVNVTPDRCFPGGTIDVFGWVKPNHPGDTIVILEFTKPVPGPAIRREVKTDPDGKYLLKFNETFETGTWKVSAHLLR